MEALHADTGIEPRLVEFYLQWPSEPNGGIFPRESLAVIKAAGAVAVLSWEPMFIDSAGAEHVIPADSVTSGKYDPISSDCLGKPPF